MAVEIPKNSYSGSIRAISVAGDKGFTVGGETTMPFYTFEGEMPNKTRIAIEINDIVPEEWAPELERVWGDVYKDPVAWAKKAQDEFHADLIHLELVGTDPNGKNLGPEHAAEVAKKVAEAIDVPLTVWGSSNQPNDIKILRAVAEAVTDRQLLIGPIQDENYKQIGAGVMAYNHIAVANSPIDINLAKQLNILLSNLGVKDGQIIIDPTIGGLGYGLEYAYSVMERARLAALVQQDEKLQYPIYANLGREAWKSKEVKQTIEEAPELGDPVTRGILVEAATAVACLIAGANVLVLRHPKTIELIRQFAEEMSSDEAPVYVKLPEASGDVEIKLDAKAAPKAAPKPAPKPAAKPAEDGAKKKAEAEAKAKEEAKKKAETEAKAKAEAEAKAKEEEKKKAEEAAKVKAMEEAKAKEEAAKPAPAAPVVEAKEEAITVSADEADVDVAKSFSLPGSATGPVRIVITVGEDEGDDEEIAALRAIVEQQQAAIKALKEQLKRRMS